MKPCVDGFLQSRGVIPHRDLVIQVDAQFRKLCRDKLRVRVERLPHEQFRAHANDFSYH